MKIENKRMEFAMENVTTGTPSNSSFPPRTILSGRKKRSPKLIERLYDYAMGNLISVISAVGIFWGGLIILIYLMGESYFPADLDASSIGLLLAAAALVGIVLALLFGLYFILPGYIYRHILADEYKEDSIELLSNRAIILLLDVPAIAVVAIFLIWLMTESATSVFLLLIFDFPVLVLLAAIYAYQCTNNIERNRWEYIKVQFNALRASKFEWKKAHVVAVVSVILSAFPWLLILLLAIGYSRNGADDPKVWTAIIVMSIVVVVSNHVIARVEKLWALFIVPFAVLFIVFVLTQQINLIPRMVVHALTIGDIRNATLQLDEQGCQITMQYASLISDVTKNVPYKKTKYKKPTVCTLSSTTIAWRIGNEYLIDATNETDLKNTTTSELFFEVEEKDKQSETVQIQPASPSDKCKPVAVEDTEIESTFPRYTLNSKFTLPASHVLSWEAKKIEAK